MGGISEMLMVVEEHNYPPLPEIGKSDVYYHNAIALAEKEGDVLKRATMKVGRYITKALTPKIPWVEKVRYFDHALKHHCTPPMGMEDEKAKAFYEQLADLVRQHCGAEALRLASQEDDMYAARVALGQEKPMIEEDADVFFGRLLGTGDHRPDYFNEIDWSQLKLIRDQWI